MALRLQWRQREDQHGFHATAGVFQLHAYPEGKRWTGAMPMEGLTSKGHGEPEEAQKAAEALAETAALQVLRALREQVGEGTRAATVEG